VGGDDGVDAVLVNGFLVDNGLNYVMDMMVGMLVNNFTLVNDAAFDTSMLCSIAVLPDLAVEQGRILILTDVLFVDPGLRNDPVVVFLLAFFLMSDRNDMVLYVMNVAIMFPLALNFLDFNFANALVGDGVELGVVLDPFARGHGVLRVLLVVSMRVRVVKVSSTGTSDDLFAAAGNGSLARVLGGVVDGLVGASGGSAVGRLGAHARLFAREGTVVGVALGCWFVRGNHVLESRSETHW